MFAKLFIFYKLLNIGSLYKKNLIGIFIIQNIVIQLII